jgi:hypothetical protein
MDTHFFPGKRTWLASDSPLSSFSGVFEDDGDTAYFYAYDRATSDQPILDAVHIYDVANVVDQDKQSKASITWSPDGLKAGLLINERLFALLDFDTRKAYSRSNFPPPGGAWSGGERVPWSDTLEDLLR